MRHMLRKTVVTVAAMSVLLVVPTTPASAAANHLSGVGIGVDECDGYSGNFNLELTGALEGCLYNTSFEYIVEDNGALREYGTEHFAGCLTVDGEQVCGSFDLRYTFRATFDDNGVQLTGQCNHPIVAGSGTGGFEGATGLIDFRDDLETGLFIYRGHINLP